MVPNPSRNDLNALISEELSRNPEFRARLLADPRGVVSELVGVDVPEAVVFHVHEESPADIHLVLPTVTHLSDEDLELVAGGWDVKIQPPGCH